MHAQAVRPNFQKLFPPSRLSCVGPYWQHATSESQPWQQKQHKCSSSDGGGVQEDKDVCITEKSLTYRTNPTWLCTVLMRVRKWKNQKRKQQEGRGGKKRGKLPEKAPYSFMIANLCCVWIRLSVMPTYTPYISPHARGTLIISRPTGNAGLEVDEV